jgi:hypothetical protein
MRVEFEARDIRERGIEIIEQYKGLDQFPNVIGANEARQRPTTITTGSVDDLAASAGFHGGGS